MTIRKTPPSKQKSEGRTAGEIRRINRKIKKARKALFAEEYFGK